MDGAGEGAGWEQAYASKAVHPQHIAALSREERRKIIEDYQVRRQAVRESVKLMRSIECCHARRQGWLVVHLAGQQGQFECGVKQWRPAVVDYEWQVGIERVYLSTLSHLMRCSAS